LKPIQNIEVAIGANGIGVIRQVKVGSIDGAEKSAGVFFVQLLLPAKRCFIDSLGKSCCSQNGNKQYKYAFFHCLLLCISGKYFVPKYTVIAERSMPERGKELLVFAGFPASFYDKKHRQHYIHQQ
jgi:hypothetical protein